MQFNLPHTLYRFSIFALCALALSQPVAAQNPAARFAPLSGAEQLESQRGSFSRRSGDSRYQRPRGESSGNEDSQRSSGSGEQGDSGSDSQTRAAPRRAPRAPAEPYAPSRPVLKRQPRESEPARIQPRGAYRPDGRDQDAESWDAQGDEGGGKTRERHIRPPRQDRPGDYERPDKRHRDKPKKRRYMERPRRTDRRSDHDHRRKSRRHRHPHGYWPWYHTYFISPVHWYFHPIGYHTHSLPHGWIRIGIHGGHAYFYFSGVFYRAYDGGYIVAGAPIGALIAELPHGYIAFSIGDEIFYYLNRTYYVWDDSEEVYVVVEKPRGADEAMHAATAGRLNVAPLQGQDPQQQARDRYECHRWAVSASRLDPTLEDADYDSPAAVEYRRAIAACLRARGYAVD